MRWRWLASIGFGIVFCLIVTRILILLQGDPYTWHTFALSLAFQCVAIPLLHLPAWLQREKHAQI